MELNSQLINKNKRRLSHSQVEPSEVLATTKYSIVGLKNYLDELSLLKIAENVPKKKKEKKDGNEPEEIQYDADMLFTQVEIKKTKENILQLETELQKGIEDLPNIMNKMEKP